MSSSLSNEVHDVRRVTENPVLSFNISDKVEPVWSSAGMRGEQQGVNLLAAVTVLITDVCWKRIAAGNKDTAVSAAAPWCDSIRQEDAYWQGEKGGQTQSEREREKREKEGGSNQSWIPVTLALTQCHESPRHYFSNRTGALFKLKHPPGAECQQKGTRKYT